MSRPGAMSALVLSLALFSPACAETIAVLPFVNLSGNANLDWIGESIAERTRVALATYGLLTHDRDEQIEAIRKLGLRERALVTRATIIRIGDTLDADKLVFGEFSLNAGTLKISAQIVDVRRMRQGSEFSEIGALEDLATLETHLAWQTLRFLAPKTAPSEAAFRATPFAVRLEAEEHYIRGLLSASHDEKLKLFTRATQLDGRYSRPAFALAKLYYGRKEYKMAAPWLERVPATDPQYSEANFLLGLCRFYGADYAGAESAFKTVASRFPLGEVLNNLGAAQSRQNSPEGLESFRKALEGDPSDPMYHFNVGYALYKRGDLNSAAESFRAVLDRDPQDQTATSMLGRCLKRTKLAADPRAQNLERVKTNYEERAWRQLKAMVEARP